jgi:subtilase family serine protease
MSTNTDKDGSKNELPQKKDNSQKIIIAVLLVAVLFLTAALLGVLTRGTDEVDKSDKSDFQTSQEEKSVSQPISETSNDVSTNEENISAGSASSDSSSSDSSASDSSSTVQYPDLYIVNYDFSEEPKSGEEFTVNIKIGNKGKANAKSFHWEWYPTASGKDCDGKVDSLAVGKTVTVGCKFTYSSWAVYTTKVVIDSQSEIYESNESNNTASKEVIPIHDQAKSDLYVSEYKFNHPPKEGEPFTISIDFYNKGDVATGSFWWEWWSTHSTRVCRAKIDNVGAHGGKVVTCTYTYNSWANYTTKAVADADNDISESDESNNVYTENVIPIH